MTSISIPFPTAIDPEILVFGPVVIRWYAVAYIAGILLGWRYVVYLAKMPPATITAKEADDLVVWLTLGVIIGGRIGYVLFYRPAYYLENPLEALAIWNGGMSFHGGLLGVTVAIYLFSLIRRQSIFEISDIVSVATPIGLLFGRIANFINDELWGRVSTVAWAVEFPNGGFVPRHPSQLYEAGLEGLLLMAILAWLWHARSARTRPGFITGTFLIGYAAARMFAEVFREPDTHIGFLFGGVSMGQILSLPLLFFGFILIILSYARAKTS